MEQYLFWWVSQVDEGIPSGYEDHFAHLTASEFDMAAGVYDLLNHLGLYLENPEVPRPADDDED